MTQDNEITPGEQEMLEFYLHMAKRYEAHIQTADIVWEAKKNEIKVLREIGVSEESIDIYMCGINVRPCC